MMMMMIYNITHHHAILIQCSYNNMYCAIGITLKGFSQYIIIIGNRVHSRQVLVLVNVHR